MIKKWRNFMNDQKLDSLLFRYFFGVLPERSPQQTDYALLFCVLRRGARGCPPSKQDVWHSIHTHSPLFNCYIYKGLSRRRTHGSSSAPGLENSVVFGHRYWTDMPFFSPFFLFSLVNRYSLWSSNSLRNWVTKSTDKLYEKYFNS